MEKALKARRRVAGIVIIICVIVMIIGGVFYGLHLDNPQEFGNAVKIPAQVAMILSGIGIGISVIALIDFGSL